jgi:hypothetical protein
LIEDFRLPFLIAGFTRLGRWRALWNVAAKCNQGNPPIAPQLFLRPVIPLSSSCKPSRLKQHLQLSANYPPNWSQINKAKENSKLGVIFSKWVDTVKNFYDLSAPALIKSTSAASPPLADVQVAYQLLGSLTGTDMKIPGIIPPAPKLSSMGHWEHFDYSVEWVFVTHGLKIACGGKSA